MEWTRAYNNATEYSSLIIVSTRPVNTIYAFSADARVQKHDRNLALGVVDNVRKKTERITRATGRRFSTSTQYYRNDHWRYAAVRVNCRCSTAFFLRALTDAGDVSLISETISQRVRAQKKRHDASDNRRPPPFTMNPIVFVGFLFGQSNRTTGHIHILPFRRLISQCS